MKHDKRESIEERNHHEEAHQDRQRMDSERHEERVTDREKPWKGTVTTFDLGKEEFEQR